MVRVEDGPGRSPADGIRRCDEVAVVLQPVPWVGLRARLALTGVYLICALPILVVAMDVGLVGGGRAWAAGGLLALLALGMGFTDMVVRIERDGPGVVRDRHLGPWHVRSSVIAPRAAIDRFVLGARRDASAVLWTLDADLRGRLVPVWCGRDRDAIAAIGGRAASLLDRPIEDRVPADGVSPSERHGPRSGAG